MCRDPGGSLVVGGQGSQYKGEWCGRGVGAGRGALAEVLGELVEGLLLIRGHLVAMLEGEVSSVDEVGACSSDQLGQGMDTQWVEGLQVFC